MDLSTQYSGFSYRWFFVFLLITRLAAAQSTNDDGNFRQLDQRTRQLMDSAHVPGLSIAIIRDNKLAYSHGYGLTKVDSTQHVTSSTVFEAASLSKPVFAYAVLQLVEEGKLDLDKPLYEYLPYPDAADDERYQKITARLVLSHRSGFPNWRKNRQSPKLSMLFSPGKRFGYSGEGFVYLQKVVEKITGKPINDVMEERVLKPLGMTNSGFVWKASFNANFAQPHNESGNVEPKYKPTQANMAYSLHTTANDYARFVLALLTPTGLKPATVSQMLSAQSQLPKRFSDSTTLAPDLFWGLGIGLEQPSSDTYIWHWGDNGAFKCYVTAHLSRKEAVIYFTNSTSGLDFADELLRLTLGGQHPALGFLGINWRDEVRKRVSK
ncbi:beta-lactamase family protein [Spirosoma sp. RP8]|uniref:Beta-lactamase family protein n=1 Tax=Spirosoma liriopis TaxID=2937440 RepID=A0ABT0HN56_9BACT|nr:serine hydrolase domain-containing protein [Spirosoma liriopis]MCK8493596.1 beta-lactamase family protein [Spirosoma liriopis]